LGGSTLGARIGRIAPDNGRGVGIAGWRGSDCAIGRNVGGAANSEGVTGSGFGAAGVTGAAAGAGETGGGAGLAAAAAAAWGGSGARGATGDGVTFDVTA